jgi:hypothetical protein
MNEDFWVGYAIGAVAGIPLGLVIAPYGLWLIDRVKWWLLETGRTSRYNGGDWAFTRRDIDMPRMIAGWEKHRGGPP